MKSPIQVSFRILQVLKAKNKDSNPGISIVSQKLSTPFPAEKLMSPGIHQSLFTQFKRFLTASFDECRNLVPEGIQPYKIQADELRAIADLLDKGERILDIFVYNESGEQVIVLRVKEPE